MCLLAVRISSFAIEANVGEALNRSLIVVGCVHVPSLASADPSEDPGLSLLQRLNDKIIDAHF